ncbi:hypothetical protein [Streptomyces sp. NPDC048002]|uniref:hypothetical protein n=1 Tax=Streptomyces sp. NPDC048002 TaxID=3154344 RepID=UPI003403B5EC
MSGWGHGPSEEQGRAPWSGRQPDEVVPPWSTAETQVHGTPPPYVPTPPSPPPPPPPSPPYVPTPPSPSPPRTSRPRPVLLALLAAVVLGAGLGAGVWALLRDDGGGGGRAGAAPATDATVTTGPSPRSSPSAQDSPSEAGAPSPQDSPSPQGSPSARAEAPPGYRRAADPVGYTLFVPEGWIRRQTAGEAAPVVFYDAPDDGRRLQIFRITEASVEESLARAETDPGYGFESRTGYRALARDSGPGFVELTYRYDDEDKGPSLVVDHRFRAADGTPYAIRAAGPEELAPESVRAPLDEALTSFCPADTECG